MPTHVVKQGECLSSIALKYGFSWEALWNSGDNSALKQKRKDPNILYPGDKVVIPKQDQGGSDAATGAKHTYKLKGVPVKLRMKLLKDGKPRKNEEYVLHVGSKTFRDSTDGDGKIQVTIPPDATTGKLQMDNGAEEYMLYLAHLDPIDTISGMQARLNTLGYPCGVVDGIMGPHSRYGLRKFQKHYDLQVDGIYGPQSQGKLKEVYGC